MDNLRIDSILDFSNQFTVARYQYQMLDTMVLMTPMDTNNNMIIEINHQHINKS